MAEEEQEEEEVGIGFSLSAVWWMLASQVEDWLTPEEAGEVEGFPLNICYHWITGSREMLESQYFLQIVFKVTDWGTCNQRNQRQAPCVPGRLSVAQPSMEDQQVN